MMVEETVIADMERHARFSDDGKLRYLLRRRWPVVATDGISAGLRCLFVALNPSVANGRADDATTRLCVGIARRMGCSSMAIVNLFAFIATDPAVMLRHSGDDLVGPDNDWCIEDACQQSDVRIAAWGTGPPFAIRDRERFSQRCDSVLGIVARYGPVWCLGRTSAGMPRHPRGVPINQKLELLRSVSVDTRTEEIE